jgi:trk system potassium uptake protein TrkH
MVDASSLASLRRTIAVICCYTLLIEAIGAFILYGQFQAYPEILMRYGHDLAGPGSVLWAAIFHSVNAFCNAGFSNVYAGLVPFVSNQFIMLAIVALVLLGGIGFPVLDELGRVLFLKLRRRRAPMLSLNTRVALRTSGLLLVGMALSYVILEWTASMKNLAYPDRITAALFQSAAARSAGFNVIDVAAMRPAALVLTCAAMFVGASPGGAGGGIKTTTLAALYSGLRAELSGKAPTLLNRRLPDSVIRKAIGVAFLSIVIVTTAFFLLLLLEPHAPLDLAFETISAFSTTGLSTGITPKLSVPGKLLITFMMFIGRIGPLTLALAVSVRPRERAVEMPEERVMIG